MYLWNRNYKILFRSTNILMEQNGKERNGEFVQDIVTDTTLTSILQ